MSRKSPVWYLIGSLLVYFVLWIGVPKARFVPALLGHLDYAVHHAHQPMATILPIVGIILISIPTVAFMVTQMSIVYYFAKLQTGLRAGLLWLAGCAAGLALIVGVMVWRIDAVGKLHRLPTVREIGFIVAGHAGTLLGMLLFALILLTAASIGSLISLRIKDKNLLLPVVMFAATVDLWTVTVGPVSSAMQHAPEVVKAVSAPIPQAGAGAFVPTVTMGPGDPLFIALVFAAVHRLGLDARRNYKFIVVLMTAAMLCVMLGFVPFLPALVVLAVAVVAANWGQFKLSKQEKVSTAIVGLVLVTSLPLVWHALKPQEMPRKPSRPPVSAPRSQP